MAVGVLLLVVGTSVGMVHASIQSQINTLNNQNAEKQSAVNSLQLQATSYQDAINKLQAQIGAIQGAIAASEAKQSQLQTKITADQQEINQQKQVLGEDLKAMYVNGGMTTIEMLATSKNLSDFVNAETYDSAVQNKIQNTLNQITALQNQLEDQKNQVQQLLQTQQAQQNQLASDQAQQNHLLSLNQNQQADYNNQIKANQSKISSLEAEQAAINEDGSSAITLPASGGVGGNCATPNYAIGGTYYYSGPESSAPNGGYPMPWCNAAQDSTTTYGGFPNRECTSFAYWYFTTEEGHNGFSVTGNADQWWYTANRPVDLTPVDGSIAVDPSGPYGHVMIVVATPGQTYGGGTVPNGKIDTISMNDDYSGHFFAMQRPYSGFYFIH
jgi:peptidoglycan DL-endopeptidase CwlO